MHWLVCALLPWSAGREPAPVLKYRVVDFEARLEGQKDEPVPDLKPICGLTIGDTREDPCGNYCGITWQAGYPPDSRNDFVGGWWVWDARSLVQRIKDEDTGEYFQWYPSDVLDGLPSPSHVASNYGRGQDWIYSDPPETHAQKCTAWFITTERIAGVWIYQTGDRGMCLRTLDGRKTQPLKAVRKWTWLPVGWEPSREDGKLFVFFDPRAKGNNGGWLIDDLVLGGDPPDPANLARPVR